MSGARRWVALLAALALVAPALRAEGEEELPARQRVLLLLRVLAYDRNLKARAGEVVAVAVLFQKGNARSEECQKELLAAFEEVASTSVVAGLPIQARGQAWAGGAALDAELQHPRTSSLYACPGLESVVPAIREVARRRSSFTAAGGRAMVEAGLSLGLIKGGARAGLVINLEAARAEGVDLDSALLRIAEVLRQAERPETAGGPKPSR
jgi:hypothetical protein